MTRRINISIVDGGRTLNRALSQIDPAQLQLVGGAFRDPGQAVPGILDVARGTAPNDRPCKLDLIAHALDGELVFSKWLISPTEEQSASLKRQLDQGTIDEIRLLGCRTGATDAGRASMRHLKNVLGVRIFGTTDLIGARDFGFSGFENDDVLVEHDDLPQTIARNMAVGPLFADRQDPAPRDAQKRIAASAPEDPALFNRLEAAPTNDLRDKDLRPETEDEARAEARLYDATPGRWLVKDADSRVSLTTLLSDRDPTLRVAPGLLLIPDVEVLFPIPSTDSTVRYFRVTSLLGGWLLRVYPSKYPDGVLLRPSHQVLL
jgi:hypothetical protein